MFNAKTNTCSNVMAFITKIKCKCETKYNLTSFSKVIQSFDHLPFFAGFFTFCGFCGLRARVSANSPNLWPTMASLI